MHDEVTLLRETVAHQKKEIERLQYRLEDEYFARELRDALTLTALTANLSAPVSHSRLLEMIVETAADIIAADAAALFLIDEAEEYLRFEVAIGQKGEAVKGFRVPLGHGIAGLVAVTGQPMAVSDTQHDPRHASDIAQNVGYQPNSILCVPLFYDDRIIGVLELLDKQGAPSFRPEDIDTLSLFANQAAVAIEQSRHQQSLTALLGDALDRFAATSNGQSARLHGAATTFARGIEQDETYQSALQLAQMVKEITGHGYAEQTACTTILRSFVSYLRLRPTLQMTEAPAL